MSNDLMPREPLHVLEQRLQNAQMQYGKYKHDLDLFSNPHCKGATEVGDCMVNWSRQIELLEIMIELKKGEKNNNEITDYQQRLFKEKSNGTAPGLRTHN